MLEAPIRILIVDDHAIVREGLSAILETEEGFQVVGLAADSREAHRCYDEVHPDVTLLDVCLAGESGLDVLCAIMGRHPEAKVLMISAYDHGEDIHRALTLGARGFVLKDLGGDDLVAAIRAVRAGGRPIPPRGEGHLSQHAAVETLSAREREVLMLLGRGFCNAEISHRLGIAEATTKAHLSHVFEKLGVSDRTQAALVALRAGLIRLE